MSGLSTNGKLKALKIRRDYLQHKILLQKGSARALSYQGDELEALDWVLSLAENIRIELQAHEDEINELNERIKQYEDRFGKIETA